jgi:D-alanyl-lipoteichoic acid acyltransferase DltB (MBOAT superfamily)
MLFNTYGFIFVFLPVTLIGFFTLARISHAFAASWLSLASIFFYGYWNPAYVGLLLGSITCNYILGVWIAKSAVRGEERAKQKLLIFAIAANLSLLGYYKYSNFFISNFNSIASTDWSLASIILPLGISFFTFTQIAFLADTYQGKVKEYNFTHYLLFVSYFPHLIAGPVLHHKQMMPQFNLSSTYRISLENISIGITFLTIGLAKKVLLADSLAEYATPVFGAAHDGMAPQLFGAWVGALAYTLQLYFDFSGYSDMAIGISKMFGVNLPINFNSPYKAHNIIEFWRRWHMTLSQFLRDYLYIPLGGNRKGPILRYVNLLVTMLLGGLWHGANWTFVIWGGLHGLYLCANHFWQYLLGSAERPNNRIERFIGMLITFLAVVFAWVCFRAENMHTAVTMIKGMLGMNGVALPVSLAYLEKYTVTLPVDIKFIGLFYGLNVPLDIMSLLILFSISFFVIWGLPNSQQLLDKDRFHGYSKKGWMLAGSSFGFLFVLSVLSFNRVSEFLYFQF